MRPRFAERTGTAPPQIASGGDKDQLARRLGQRPVRGSGPSSATLTPERMRFPGDVAFALALMAADFVAKLGPLYPGFAKRLRSGQQPRHRLDDFERKP
jgi:hypothetical protein